MLLSIGSVTIDISMRNIYFFYNPKPLDYAVFSRSKKFLKSLLLNNFFCIKDMKKPLLSLLLTIYCINVFSNLQIQIIIIKVIIHIFLYFVVVLQYKLLPLTLFFAEFQRIHIDSKNISG